MHFLQVSEEMVPERGLEVSSRIRTTGTGQWKGAFTSALQHMEITFCPPNNAEGSKHLPSSLASSLITGPTSGCSYHSLPPIGPASQTPRPFGLLPSPRFDILSLSPEEIAGCGWNPAPRQLYRVNPLRSWDPVSHCEINERPSLPLQLPQTWPLTLQRQRWLKSSHTASSPPSLTTFSSPLDSETKTVASSLPTPFRKAPSKWVHRLELQGTPWRHFQTMGYICFHGACK